MSNRFTLTVGTALVAASASTAIALAQDHATVHVKAIPVHMAVQQSGQKPAAKQVQGQKATAKSSANSSAGTAAKGTQSSESSQTCSISDGGLTVEVTRRVKSWTDEEGNTRHEEKSDTKATLDGKEVPADRVRTTDGTVEILDEKGAVLRSIALPDMHVDANVDLGDPVVIEKSLPNGFQVFSSRAGSNSGAKASSRAGGSATSSSNGKPMTHSITIGEPDHPKVMLGMTMELPDEAMATQANVDAEESTVVLSVTPDLPAAKGGLQQHDIIVSIDGTRPATPGRIREQLKGKEPGQSMAFGVVRGGKPTEVTVELEAWDGEKLGLSDVSGMTFTLGHDLGSIQMDDEMRRQIEEMMRRFQDHLGANGGANILDDAFVQQLFAPVPNGKGRSLRFFGPAAPVTPPTPVVPGQAGPSDNDERIQMLEDRIDKLNETIKRLEELLAEQAKSKK